MCLLESAPLCLCRMSAIVSCSDLVLLEGRLASSFCYRMAWSKMQRYPADWNGGKSQQKAIDVNKRPRTFISAPHMARAREYLSPVYRADHTF